MSFQIDLNSVKIVDSLNDLSIYHYLDCDVNTDKETKKYRGVVMNNEGKTICRSFGFTPEIDETDDELMTSVVEPFLSEQVRVLEAYEGTLLRVYFYQDKWYISTCRKLDAFKSKWGSNKSFGELFEDCIEMPFEQFCKEQLDETKVYCYVLRTYNKNRIVCTGYEFPNLFLVGTYDNGDFDNFNFEKCNVPLVYNISTMDELKEHMEKVESSKSQGVILMNEQGECVKVMKHEYVEAFKLRGNQPNILLRYIELQQEGDAKKVETFYNMYPEQKDLIVGFTEVIDDICYYVFRKYRNRFIRKQVSIVPSDLYYVIRELHDGYLKDRTNIVTPERVSTYILGLECTRLLGLYNSYMKRKEENGNGFKISEEFMTKVKSMIV